MVIKTLPFISLLYTLFISFSLLASEVEIIAYEIPGLHQGDGLGAYDKIVSETVIHSQLASLNVYPPARAEGSFSNCQNCCISPANKNDEFLWANENFLQTEPMAIAKVYIFVAPGQLPIYRLEDLLGKKVGLRRGMPYGKSIDSIKNNLDIVSVSRIKQNIRMVQAGRIDAFIAFTPDAYNAFRNIDLKPFPHDTSRPIATFPDSLVCRGVNPEFIEKFNNRLHQMRISGRIKRILDSNYITE